MSPTIWRELIVPGEKTEYNLIKSAGKDVWIHSCSNVEVIIPDLIAMGVDVLNPLQPECMDIYEIKAKYGEKLMFWGGISTQQTLPYGTPDEYEMYNLTLDPLESVNLANPYYSNERIVAIRRILNSILQEQCRKKRLSPSSGSVPGMPSC